MNNNDYSSFFGEDHKSKLLVFDISNLLHRTFYANKSVDDKTVAGLAHHQALMTLNKYYKLYKPDKVIMTFDRPNWRKDYTKTENCYSKKVYKGQRRQDMTDSERQRYEQFCDHLREFEQIMREHTSVICLAADKLEADDLMAGVAQQFHETCEIVMISADKDLMQLLKYDSVSLIDPATGNPRTLEEYDNDADYFMFFKCIRGDTGDNVPSSYPRLNKNKIRAAYDDAYACEQIMNFEFTDKDNRQRVVKRQFAENMLLMGLEDQPQYVRDLMDETIGSGMENPGAYSHFHFMKFCGTYDLERVKDSISQYIKLLSC